MASIHAKFYIPNLYRLVKKYIYYCEFCQIEKKKQFVQPFSALPSTRTNFTAPFESICIDFFGPLNYRNSKQFYGLIATCLVSRVVKLEVVQSLSAKATLESLNRIFLLCGTPKVIYSDNGKNFIRASKEIKKLFNFVQDLKQSDDRCIDWIFSPPHAPWFNGTAERLIAVVKRCLRVFDNEFRSIENARYMFLQVESEINNRPIIQNDERWLSAFELAYGRPQEPLKLLNDSDKTEIGSAFRWLKHLNNIRNKFEKLWRQHYAVPPPPPYDNINNNQHNSGCNPIIITQQPTRPVVVVEEPVCTPADCCLCAICAICCGMCMASHPCC
uniref:Uncharacterized protein LOC113798659 n=1 Tax=Dermatophagoides pteronyssinus TaxID=6956 RepID=A0A6P6YHN3_DERPT|nr:uncharacterized protein LOC113798659 [Dermatophagoides pteronyssinus]